MADKLQPVRGTHDILPDEFEKFSAVVTRARELATLYGFREMATPIFEATEVFKRSMGETSDVVSKEMFAFDTKGGENVCLRPEFTAGIARAFISNGMQQNLPLKLFSTGPLFRYERPQKGRQRQFHQVNFEWLGDDSAEADIEMIILAGHLLFTLSGGKGCTLLINTLGDRESRAKYRDALVTFLTPHTATLSEDSQRRLRDNPLRILDSKDPRDQEITTNAPRITDYLSDTSRARFDKICAILKSKDMLFFQEVKIAPSLVRGLDYYSDTVFEFIANTGELGTQNTVLAGGRYDGLIEQMGGKPTPAIGFAAGVERLLLLMQNNPKINLEVRSVKIAILPLDDVDFAWTHYFAGQLRNSISEHINKSSSNLPVYVDILWQGKLGKRMEKAAKTAATHAIIFGGDEFKAGMFVIKNMQTGKQGVMPLDAIFDPHVIASAFNL
jgi:histidyl-tRNA synthetase